jgi:hypothetical protein
MDNQPNNPQLKQTHIQNKLIQATASLACAAEDLDEAAKAIKPYAARLLAERATITEGDTLAKLRGDIAFLGKSLQAHEKEVDALLSEFNKHQACGHFS